MESSSTLVIKVKYGDVLRRFNALVVHKELNLSMDGLRQKIVSLFSFAPDTELMLTYIDEDNDVINLVDDDDILDAVKQSLNPLRITVKVNSGENGEQYASLSESSTPLRSPRVQQPTQNLHTGVPEILRTLPDPLLETLVKLSTDLASKASSSAPVIGELVDSLSKASLSYLDLLSKSQPGVQSSMRSGVSRSTDATENKDSELHKVDPTASSDTLPVTRSDLSSNGDDNMEGLKPGAAKENEVKIPTVMGGRRDSPFDFTAVAAALEYMNVALPSNESLLSPVPVYPKADVSRTGKKEKLKKIVEMSPLPPVGYNVGTIVQSCGPTSNLLTTEEVARNPNEPNLGANHTNVGVSDCRTGEHVDLGGRAALHDGVGKSSFSVLAPGVMNECPFSGVAVGHDSTLLLHPSSEAINSGRSIRQTIGSQNVVHHGFGCDGCDAYPITGPRFKSKVKVDYDLCSTCFEKMGNDADYFQMDSPVLHRRHMPYIGGYHDAQPQGLILPQVYSDHKVKPDKIKLDSCFVDDVNIIDGTVVAPLTPFTKIWRMRNNGTVEWLQGTQLVWIGGDKLSNTLSVELKIPAGGVRTDEELDVMVDFISPELPGHYISYWRMATLSGERFGQRVWVLVQVNAYVKKTRETIRNLNLNLPPVSNGLDGPEIINVELEPPVKGSHLEPDNSTKIVELVQLETEQDLKFPINGSLLVGNGASSSIPFTSSSVSYPIVDLSDASPSPPSVTQTKSETLVATPLHSAVNDLRGENQVEEKLLRELNEMGFKQADLNKAILRRNSYNLEQAVDDLLLRY